MSPTQRIRATPGACSLRSSLAPAIPHGSVCTNVQEKPCNPVVTCRNCGVEWRCTIPRSRVEIRAVVDEKLGHADVTLSQGLMKRCLTAGVVDVGVELISGQQKLHNRRAPVFGGQVKRRRPHALSITPKASGDWKGIGSSFSTAHRRAKSVGRV